MSSARIPSTEQAKAAAVSTSVLIFQQLAITPAERSQSVPTNSCISNYQTASAPIQIIASPKSKVMAHTAIPLSSVPSYHVGKAILLAQIKKDEAEEALKQKLNDSDEEDNVENDLSDKMFNQDQSSRVDFFGVFDEDEEEEEAAKLSPTTAGRKY
jgi:hypothetical protein